MSRINLTVTMNGIYSYEAPQYGAYWKSETRYIYNMADENGKVYVWKTTKFMCEKFLDPVEGWDIDANGNKWNYSKINKGDIIEITATVKGESEYKGQPQTELTRVTVVKRTFKAKTWEEIQAERKAEREAQAQEQRNSLQGEDFIWRMPYKQYKEHYSDCETVLDSFERNMYDGATIAVIIREGRLKASGVRGKHYSGYRLVNEEGERVVYRAISEETAIKHADRDFPFHVWTCDYIYNYQY